MATLRDRRPNLAALASGLVVAALLLVPALGGPPPALAGDVKCDANPEACGTLTIRLTGLGTGDAFAGAETGGNDGYMTCHRQSGLTEGVCSAMYYVPVGSRTVWVTGDPGENTTACIDTTECGPGFVYGYVTLTAGSRASKTIDFSWTNPRTITVQKTGTGTGSVSSKPVGISCGSTCSTEWPAGITAGITGTPAAGSTLFEITLNGEACALDVDDNMCVFVVENDTTVVVHFKTLSTPAPSRTPAATKAPTPKPTAAPTPKPVTPPPPAPASAVPTTSAAPPPTASASSQPTAVPATTVAPSPVASASAAAAATLPPIATRAPAPAAEPAAAPGDLTPWLLVILVTLVVTSGYVLLGRFRRRGAAGP
jgi:hypothetical protein